MESVADRIHAHEKARERAHKSEARRKFVSKTLNTLWHNKGKILGGVLATAITVDALAQAGNFFRGEASPANAFRNGTVEFSPNAIFRSTPQINNAGDGQVDNVVPKESIEEIKTKGGKWVEFNQNDTITVNMPGVFRKDESRPEAIWYVIDAKVKELGLFDVEKRLYVDGNPKDNAGNVKVTDPGNIYELGGNSGTDWTGTVTITNH